MIYSRGVRYKHTEGRSAYYERKHEDKKHKDKHEDICLNCTKEDCEDGECKLVKSKK